MKESRFSYQFDPNYKGTPGQAFTDPSLTVPDQSITIKELLERHTRGLPIDQKNYEHVYGVDVPEINDLTDLDNMRDELMQKKLELEKIIENETKGTKAEASSPPTTDEKDKDDPGVPPSEVPEG